MTLTPSTREELAAALRAAGEDRLVAPRIDRGRLNRICRYAPEDLTVTVESGLALGALQAALGRHGQWLPIDPPGADGLSVGDVLDLDLSGPRRYGHGTIREHLIGLRVALADGRIIRSGGEVVKNVAGYDLMKLFVGARGSLGVIVEAAFKLLPRPAREAVVGLSCPSWDEASRGLQRILESALTPVVLDLHNLGLPAGMTAMLVVGFAGTEEEVEWQLAEARVLGVAEPASLAYAGQLAAEGAGPVVKESVLPSRLVETLRALGGVPLVARAGNGIVYHRGGAERVGASAVAPGVATLMRKLKDTFDPGRILPEAPIP